MTIMNILGINIMGISYSEMYPIFDQWLSNKNSRSHSLAVINVHICVTAFFNKKLRDMYNSADLISIDSMPFLMWARTFYNKDSDRFYAPDLMLEIGSKAEKKGYTFFLYGGFPEAPEKIERFLLGRFSGLRIVGKYSPPFRKLTEEEDQNICNMINKVNPDFLWIGLGSPKQDIWINEHINKIKGCVMIPSGATFDFFSGRIRQAPEFIRNSGFEWLFRLTQDFKRLWIRYIVYNILFILLFLLQLLRIVRSDKDGNLYFLLKCFRL